MITCKICHNHFKSLTASHLKTHNISYSDYIKKFSVKTCTFEEKRYDWKCPNQIYGESQTNLCILHEQSDLKDKKLFSEELNSLINSQENDPDCKIIHLGGIHFPKELLIKQRTFTKFVSFSESVFYDKFIISDSKFDQEVDLDGCIFNNEVIIKRVTFSQIVRFGSNTFRDILTMVNVLFHGVTFVKSIIEKEMRINHSTFHNFASFRLLKTPYESSMIYFLYVEFPALRRTLFENNDMSKISFIECDLRFAKFIDVKWVKPKFPASKRKCLIDEFINFKNGELDAKHFNRVKSNYQQLKMNFEESRNFAEAGDFYYGEMECQRKSLGLLRFLPSLNTIYWLSTGYGEKPLRAGMNLLLLISIWVVILMFMGLSPNISADSYKEIDYEFDFNPTEIMTFAKDFVNTFTYVQEILLREEKPNRIYKPVIRENAWINGDGVNTTGFILVYLQVLLLALAVRRKFRR